MHQMVSPSTTRARLVIGPEICSDSVWQVLLQMDFNCSEGFFFLHAFHTDRTSQTYLCFVKSSTTTVAVTAGSTVAGTPTLC